MKKSRLPQRAGMAVLLMIAALCTCYLYKRYQDYQSGIRTYAMYQGTITVENPEDSQEEFGNAVKTYGGDIWAWIYCPDTALNYPVVQGSDNEYYLKHLPDGTRNGGGSIFLDYENSSDFTDDNNILYGHHMNNGTMFAMVDDYKKQAFYEQHPVMYLYTENTSYRVELVAGYVLNGTDSLPRTFGSGEREVFLEKIRKQSKFRSNVEVLETDRLLTMVTCDYTWQNARYALVGRLVQM